MKLRPSLHGRAVARPQACELRVASRTPCRGRRQRASGNVGSVVFLALALLLAACAQPAREPAGEPALAAAQAPENFPREVYRRAAAEGKAVYRIDPARSIVAIIVRRGGSLARLGHDHVVVSHDVQGFVAPEEGRADLYVPLRALSVDEPAFRAEAGLDTQPSEADIAGTRSNMLDLVLDAQKFGFAVIHVKDIGKTPTGNRLDVGITLRGVTRSFDVAAQTAREGVGFRASGVLEFDQSEFGIRPFSILGGAIQVQDRLSLRFRIQALAHAELAL